MNNYIEVLPPTERQTLYIESIRKRLHLPVHMLDSHCVEHFRKPLKELDRSEASLLLDEMVKWDDLPREMMIAMGQRELF